jgi:hypothetical protein
MGEAPVAVGEDVLAQLTPTTAAIAWHVLRSRRR